MEAFYTIQGEGRFMGHAAYFIRLGGCDVGCHWCDVKESWDAAAHPVYGIDQLVLEASQHPARLAVITGGEPLMYNCAPLTEALQHAGFRTHVETSGAYDPTGVWNWITLSPKKFKMPTAAALAAADELKVVIYNRSDFAWAESFVPQLKPGCTLLMQPEWSRQNLMLPQIIDYVKDNPQWQISLQTHKFMQIP